jgi:hypothetical protein
VPTGVAVKLNICVTPALELGIVGTGNVIVAVVESTELATIPVIFGAGPNIRIGDVLI